jgi:hypothetical protein
MTKTNKKCNDNCACAHVDGKHVNEVQAKETLDYGFYSNVLKKPFERLDDLKRAEEVYYAEQKAKEDKASQKKADAQKVEDAFKALNAARKAYKEDMAQLTKEYSEELNNLKKAFELGKTDIRDTLAAAEDAYDKALKEFTAKYENYHVTLKDGDFETTISGSTKTSDDEKAKTDVLSIFDLLFGAL